MFFENKAEFFLSGWQEKFNKQTRNKKGEKRYESVRQSCNGKVQRSEGFPPSAYAHAYGYVEVRRSVYLQMLQVITWTGSEG